MIFGISMDQEICLILVKVSLSLLYQKKTFRQIYVVQVKIDDKTANMQARFLWPELWENMGKNVKTEGDKKMVTWEAPSR